MIPDRYIEKINAAGREKFRQRFVDKTITESRKDVTTFISQAVSGRQGEELQDNQFSEVFDYYVRHHIDTKHHLSVVAVPSLGKTTRLRGHILHRLGNDPTTRVVVVSGDETVSRKFVSSCRMSIQSEDGRFRAVFPEVALDNTRGGDVAMGNRMDCFYFRNTASDPDPAMEAVAAIPLSENRRVDIGIFDDFIGSTVARSKTMRESFSESFFDTWIGGRLKNFGQDGVAIAVQNCYHELDLGHQLLKRSDFVSIWFGVTDDQEKLFVRMWNVPDDYPVCPGMESVPPIDGADREYRIDLPDMASLKPSALRKLKDEMGTIYRQKWELKAQSDEDMMFPSIRGALDDRSIYELLRINRQRIDGEPLTFTREETAMFRMGWGYDISSRKRAGDALVFVAMHPSGLIVPVEAHYANGLTAMQVVGIIEEANSRGLSPSFVRVEDNAVQDRIVESIRGEASQLSWAYLVEATTTNPQNKFSEVVGLPQIETEMGNGGILLSKHEASIRPKYQKLIDDLKQTPAIPEPGKTPDGSMAFWFAQKACREKGHVYTNQRVEVLKSHDEERAADVY